MTKTEELHLAIIESKSYEEIYQLIQDGADLNEVIIYKLNESLTNDYNALELFINRLPYAKTIRELYEKNESFDYLIDELLKIFNLFIQNGADIHRINSQDRNILHELHVNSKDIFPDKYYFYKKILPILIDKGINVEQRDYNGLTPLDFFIHLMFQTDLIIDYLNYSKNNFYNKYEKNWKRNNFLYEEEKEFYKNPDYNKSIPFHSKSSISIACEYYHKLSNPIGDKETWIESVQIIKQAIDIMISKCDLEEIIKNAVIYGSFDTILYLRDNGYWINSIYFDELLNYILSDFLVNYIQYKKDSYWLSLWFDKFISIIKMMKNYYPDYYKIVDYQFTDYFENKINKIPLLNDILSNKIDTRDIDLYNSENLELIYQSIIKI